MYCRHCGKELLSDDRFCSSCGSPVIPEEVQESKTEQVQAPAPKTEEQPAPETKAAEPAAVPQAKKAPKKKEKSNVSLIVKILVVILLLQFIPLAIMGIVTLVEKKIKADKFKEAYYCETVSLKKADPGDFVEFGSYIQNEDDEEPITWIVISENPDGSKVLISKNVIEMMEADDVLEWITDDDGMIEDAFSNSEANKIVETRIPTNMDITNMKNACDYDGIMEFKWSEYVSDQTGEEYLFFVMDSTDGLIKVVDDCFWTHLTNEDVSYGVRPVIVVNP